MKPATLKALKQSIAHWRRLATGMERLDEEPNSGNCPLCNRFLGVDCIGCPVMEKTGDDECRGTPYRDARESWLYWKMAMPPRSNGEASVVESRETSFRTAAKKELAFLESLLPKKPRKKATK